MDKKNSGWADSKNPKKIITTIPNVQLLTFPLNLFFLNLSVQKRAAESRTYNRDCVILDFYDYHDIWHFLSALGLFFAFMVCGLFLMF